MSFKYTAGVLMVLGADNTIVNYLEQANVFPATRDELLSIFAGKDKALPRDLIYKAVEESDSRLVWTMGEITNSLQIRKDKDDEPQIQYIFTRGGILHNMYYTLEGNPLWALCAIADNPGSALVEAYRVTRLGKNKHKMTVYGVKGKDGEMVTEGTPVDQYFYLDDQGRVIEEHNNGVISKWEFEGNNRFAAKQTVNFIIEGQPVTETIKQLAEFDEKGYPVKVTLPSDMEISNLVNWYNTDGNLTMVEARPEDGSDFILLDLEAFWNLRKA